MNPTAAFSPTIEAVARDTKKPFACRHPACRISGTASVDPQRARPPQTPSNGWTVSVDGTRVTAFAHSGFHLHRESSQGIRVDVCISAEPWRAWGARTGRKEAGWLSVSPLRAAHALETFLLHAIALQGTNLIGQLRFWTGREILHIIVQIISRRQSLPTYGGLQATYRCQVGRQAQSQQPASAYGPGASIHRSVLACLKDQAGADLRRQRNDRGS